MTNGNNQISTEEAVAALETLENTKRKLIISFRPPLWLNFLISLFVGMTVFAGTQSSGNSIWTFITILSIAATLISIFSWYIVVRLRGVKENFVPVGFKNTIFHIARTILAALVAFGLIALYKAGFLWIPYVFGPLSAIIMSYMLYGKPMGEWK